MKIAMLICVVLLMAAGGCNNHDEQFQEILRLEDRRGDVRELTKFIMHPGAEVKRRAVIAMGRMRDPQAVTTLVDLLDSSNPALRSEAALLLARLRIRPPQKSFSRTWAMKRTWRCGWH